MPTGFIKRDTTEQLSEEEIRRAEEELKKRRRYMPLQFLKPTRGRRPIDFRKGEGGGSGAPDYNPEALAFYWRVINDGGKFENGAYVNAQFDNFNGHETFALFPAGYNQGVVYAAMPNDGLADGVSTRNSIANRTNKEQLLEEFGIDTHRIDYEGGLEVGEGLNEPSAINIIKWSESLTTSPWRNDIGAIPTGGYSIPSNTNPNGGWHLAETATSGDHYIDQLVAITDTLEYTFQILAKKAERDYLYLSCASTGLNGSVFFNLDTGVVVSNTGQFTSGTIEHIKDGFYLCTATATCNLTTSVRLRVGISADGITGSYLGDGTSGIIVGNVQFEQSSYATTYIKTEAGTVTRAADQLVGFGNADCLPSDEFSLRFNLGALANDGTERIVSVSDNSLNNYVSIGFNATDNEIQAKLIVGGVEQCNLTATATGQTDAIITAKANEAILYLDGVNESQDLTVTMPPASTFTQCQFANGNNTGGYFNGRWGLLIHYDKALTQAEIDEFQNFTIETNWNL